MEIEKKHDPSPLLRLHEDDTVGCLVTSLPKASAITSGPFTWYLMDGLSLGHKIALVPMVAGEKVIKYGVGIGSATQDIQPGEHVHLHNMRSNYLPTYTLDEGGRYEA